MEARAEPRPGTVSRGCSDGRPRAVPGSRFESGRVSAAPPWRPAHSTSGAVPPAETPGLLAPLVPPRLCARDPTQGRGWAATERRRERRSRRPPRGLDGRGGRSPLSRPERSRRLSKPFGSRSRRLPSALGRSAGPAGQGSAPQRPLPAALGEQRPSPKSGGRGGAGARERGAARRVPGMEGEKLISATDTQYSSSLLQSLNEQRGHGLFCDVTVIVEDRKFRAHRNILSASSTYFHQLLSVAGQVVELSFVRAEIFAEILNYMYSSKIISVRADLIDELIKSGQQLGVKFLADLSITPSDGRSVPGEVKDGASETSSSGPTQKDAETQVPAIRQEGREVTGWMPVITESFSLHGIAYETPKITVTDSDDDDDVIFCSEIVPPKECTKDTNAAIQNQPCPNAPGVSDQKSCGSGGGSPLLTSTTSTQKLTSSANQLNPNQALSSAESLVPGTPQHSTTELILLNRPPVNPSASVSSSHQTHVPPTINLVEESQKPSEKGPSKEVKTAAVDIEEVVEDNDDVISSSSPSSASNSSSVQQPSVPKAATSEGSGVQKKQVVKFPQEQSSKPGEFKIKISDVLTGNNKEFGPGIASKHAGEGQKIITLDTATEIEGLSTGCKVYANIGEDTYDIVIPIKDDPEEGKAKSEETPRMSDGDSSSRKRMKVKHDDHYELIVDGRVYYICIVCKRSYVCLTSLRRHFNVHSWEKKYPCRYCDKVFPLAEYRTKHEIHHTGERRYQCLTCGKSFINYQIMASHIRSVHSQDPSGDTKLYRLNPCKSLQIRQYAYISDRSSSLPVINENRIVYRVDAAKNGTEGTASNAPGKQMSWDDIFVPQGNDAIFKQNQSEGSTEFEFVIPESY